MIQDFTGRDLAMLGSLFRMSLVDRFLGSGLGLFWAVLSPLMLLGIFCFVFTFVFPSRVPGKEGTLPFVIWLVSGYGPWIALSEGLNRWDGFGRRRGRDRQEHRLQVRTAADCRRSLGLVPLFVSFGV